jgi:GNAT superfamily N-acetyltransferase
VRETPTRARAAPRRSAGAPAAVAAAASRPASQGDGVRAVRRADLDAVITLDATVTGLEKRRYWERVYRRYGMAAAREQRWFLVAEQAGRVVGFLIGEVRDWEFGSPPCGWVFGINVRPNARLAGIGARLLESIVAAFRRAGVTKVRTLLDRDNNLVLSFFRSQGMTAAPFIPLELDLEGAPR